MATELHEQLCRHLLRSDGQEDLCFALWHPSDGATRRTALLSEVIPPEPGDRRVHGNASFLPRYFERAIRLALANGAGLAFLHSHPTSGWQGMSPDDVAAEQNNAAAISAATGLPLVGLTLGTDGTWSARFWERKGQTWSRIWCATARVVGDQLSVSYMEQLAPRPRFREQLKRTVSAWGEPKQSDLARLHVGVVGAGSVGAIVAEGLARTGLNDVTLIDFDRVEKHNLDRLLHTTLKDIGRYKVDVVGRASTDHATADRFKLEKVYASVAEELGFRSALDCDVLFSCVDRPLGRSVLNFIAYAHLIPVVDGGIHVRRTSEGTLLGADWRAHVAAPGRRCLECLGQYDPGLVSLDREGRLDDPTYIDRLPQDHVLRRNENVFAFSVNCAGLQMLQFLSMVLAPMGLSDPGAQLYHFVPGIMDPPIISGCDPGCPYPKLLSQGEHTGMTVTSPRISALTERREPMSWRQLRMFQVALNRGLSTVYEAWRRWG